MSAELYSIERAGLVVMPSALDAQLVATMRREAERLIDRGSAYRVTHSIHSAMPVESVYAKASSVLNMDGIGAFVGMSLRPEQVSSGMIAVNKQHPGAFQRFHPDMKLHPVANAYLDPHGGFDFTGAGFDWSHPDVDAAFDEDPHIIPDHFGTLTTEPGDVVVQMHPWKVHRGRNLGQAVRYNVAVYTD